MQGKVIRPGEAISLNNTVGERTEPKGFVEAGVIVNGELTEDVGGGISQFATTFFQASFYAGLEIEPISHIQFGFRGTPILLEGKVLNPLSLGRLQMLKLEIPRLTPFSFGLLGHTHP